MRKRLNRRTLFQTVGRIGGAGVLMGVSGCERMPQQVTTKGPRPSYKNEEYVWLSANANLPLFTNRDHPALRLAGENLSVQVTIAGPNNIDIPGLVAAMEQTVARKPAGIMIVGWDPSALVSPINKAIDSGIPIVCVDADVPASKRIAFIGTDWHDIGVRQAEGMLSALAGRQGEVALLGLIEQQIDQDAFAGFRSIAEPAGLTVLPPQQDKGNQAEAARVAASIIQSHPRLVGMAGFDSESGPGMGQAIKEAGQAGRIIATCVDDQQQHLRLCKEGVLTTLIGQKRELFTWIGLHALFDINHSPLRFTSNDKSVGLYPVPDVYNTGAYTITRENVNLFLSV
jgi:ribose transport system substrate-binding protein